MNSENADTTEFGHNPYESPSYGDEQSVARVKLFPAAIALIVLVVLDAVVFGSYIIRNLLNALDPELDGDTKGAQLQLSVYSAVHFGCSLLIVAGAISMIRLRSHLLSTVAMWLTVIPALSPCYFLAIPFGIWGLLVLRRPEVKAAFASRKMPHLEPDEVHRHREVEQLVFPVAVSLIVTSIVGIMADGFGAAFFLGQILTSEKQGVDGTTLRTLTIYFFQTIYALVIIAGGINLSRLRSYPFSMLAASLAVVPFLAPCFVLSIPFGIWGIVVLRKPEVKEAFAARLIA